MSAINCREIICSDKYYVAKTFCFLIIPLSLLICTLCHLLSYSGISLLKILAYLTKLQNIVRIDIGHSILACQKRTD